jgi:superfamily II DNA/RNA helicase
MFSATFKKKIQNLALDLLQDPITITVGTDNASNSNITQSALIFDNDN